MTAAQSPVPVPERLLAANTATATAVGELLRAGADPAAPIPGALWTVGEAAAHLAMANRLMAQIAAGADRPYGDGTPGGLAAANEESLRAFPQRDPVPLAAVIEEQAAAFTTAVAGRDAAEPVRTPMGPMDLATFAGYLLVHQLGHGYDLARALGRPHMVDRERAELSVPFLLTAMPRVVDQAAAAGVRARFTVALRGGGPRFGVVLADGVARVTEPQPRPDCGIGCEPVAFLLLALGRMTPAQALLRGRTVAWGRRPWLAPSFPRYFRAP